MNNNRNQDIVALRPQVISESIQSNPDQLFQDVTLRPILKLQHEILLLLFSEFMMNHKIDVSALNSDQKLLLIEKCIKQNNLLQAHIKGIVVGMFTYHEFEYWCKHKEAVNKRIIQLAIKRIQSTLIN